MLTGEAGDCGCDRVGCVFGGGGDGRSRRGGGLLLFGDFGGKGEVDLVPPVKLGALSDTAGCEPLLVSKRDEEMCHWGVSWRSRQRWDGIDDRSGCGR